MPEDINVFKWIFSMLKMLCKFIYRLISKRAYNEGRLRTCFQYECDNIVRLCDKYSLQQWDAVLRTQKLEILLSLQKNIDKFGTAKVKAYSNLSMKVQSAIDNINKRKNVDDVLEIKEIIKCYSNEFRG